MPFQRLLVLGHPANKARVPTSCAAPAEWAGGRRCPPPSRAVPGLLPQRAADEAAGPAATRTRRCSTPMPTRCRRWPWRRTRSAAARLRAAAAARDRRAARAVTHHRHARGGAAGTPVTACSGDSGLVVAAEEPASAWQPVPGGLQAALDADDRPALRAAPARARRRPCAGSCARCFTIIWARQQLRTRQVMLDVRRLLDACCPARHEPDPGPP
jgi:hypothetical protein